MAKLHVKAALEAASENVRDHNSRLLIKKSYPLKNIK